LSNLSSENFRVQVNYSVERRHEYFEGLLRRQASDVQVEVVVERTVGVEVRHQPQLRTRVGGGAVRADVAEDVLVSI
jgi:hypothetical protein